MDEKEYLLRWELYEAAAKYTELLYAGEGENRVPARRMKFYDLANRLVDEHESHYEHLSEEAKRDIAEARETMKRKMEWT